MARQYQSRWIGILGDWDFHGVYGGYVEGKGYTGMARRCNNDDWSDAMCRVNGVVICARESGSLNGCYSNPNYRIPSQVQQLIGEYSELPSTLGRVDDSSCSYFSAA